MSSKGKPSVLRTLLLLILAIGAYLTIFFNIEQLNKFYLSKEVVPALCLLGTVICIAFLYGTAVSNLLSLLGLESDH